MTVSTAYGIELASEEIRPRGLRGRRSRRSDAERAPGTEALGLFLKEISRFKLLSPWEEVDLAKRIERGDRAAKERLINSNLRLVVSIARSTSSASSRCST